MFKVHHDEVKRLFILFIVVIFCTSTVAFSPVPLCDSWLQEVQRTALPAPASSSTTWADSYRPPTTPGAVVPKPSHRHSVASPPPSLGPFQQRLALSLHIRHISIK